VEWAVGGLYGRLPLRPAGRGRRARDASAAERIAEAWREWQWGAHEDGWFAVLHGEVLCRVPVS
jgi:hypothetical protein